MVEEGDTEGPVEPGLVLEGPNKGGVGEKAVCMMG